LSTSRIKRTPFLTILVALAVALAGFIAVTGAGSARGDVPPTPGWNLQWSDDFNGANRTLPSSANWQIDLGHAYPGGPGNWGTGEIQNYTNNPDNLSHDGNGNLRITPLRDGAGNWTSGRIETQRANFKAPAGGTLRIESRIQMPNVTGQAALGYWPAFWALGAPYRGNFWNWPSIGEFDIMENVNGINSVWGVLHCGVSPGGPCNETTGIGASRACPGASCQSAFHTYRFEWDRSISPNQLRWYVDDQQFHSVSQGQLPADTWNNMTSHAGYFIILNVAMGGAFPDALAGHATPTGSTVAGRPMMVDYVAVWTRNGGGGGGGRPIYGLGNKCVDVNGNNSANGTAIQIWDCNGTDAQKWTRQGDTLRALGKCMDVASGGTANGTKVQLWDCNGTGAQAWVDGGNNTLRNPQSGRCLDLPNWNTTNGNQLIIWDCHGGTNQQWRFG
jgi:ricin-type beta-trefoil lectin protein